MGFQFVHIQQFSRKPVAGKAGSDGVTRGGRAGTAGVFAEAARQPGAALHVDDPRPPVVVHGCGVDTVETRHDEMSDLARSEVAGGKARKVRQDQATLMTVVASYPATVAECEADPAKAAERDAWQARNVTWLRESFGDQLVSVVRHDDEAHPHLHAFILPGDPSMRANALHPGWSAKQDAKAEAEAAGLGSKEANAAGDRAYREAMRGFQDSYWESVGLPSGLARVGPARRRLTRDAWQAEQAVVVTTAKAMEAAEAATSTLAVAEARSADLVARGREFVAKARAAASAAKVQADEADAARADALEVVAKARRHAGALVASAKKQARQEVAQARQEAMRLRGWGARLGSVWTGLAGVQRRLERRADERVLQAQAKASAEVQAAKVGIRAEVGGELERARSSAVQAGRQAELAAIEARRAGEAQGKAEREAAAERAARVVAERERESFRGRWAEADNKLISLQRGHRR